MAKPPNTELLNLLGVSPEDALHLSNPIFFPALMWSAEQIERSVGDLFGQGLEFEPTIATLPSAPINALSVRIEAKGRHEYIVICNRGLFFFFIYLVTLLGRVLTERRGGELVVCSDGKLACELVHQNVAVQNDFARIVGGYLLKGLTIPSKDECGQVGHLTADDPTTRDDAYNEARDDTAALLEGRETREEYLNRHKAGTGFVDFLLTPVILFVMGHEYAHIVNKDKPHEGSNVEDLMQRNHQQEYSADWLGLNLMLQAQCVRGNVKPWLSYWGADFFFTACMILEQGANIFNYGMEKPHVTAGSITHPLFTTRREALRKNLHAILGVEVAETSIRLADVLDVTLSALWQHARRHIVAEHDKGSQLHPMWRLSGKCYEEAKEMNEFARQNVKLHTSECQEIAF